MSKKKNVLSFTDLCESAGLRTQYYHWNGIGDVQLHEISIKEAIERENEQAEAAIEGAQASADHGVRWAIRFLKGEFPTQSEIKKWQQNYSAQSIRELYVAGCEYNAATEDAKEVIEKK